MLESKLVFLAEKAVCLESLQVFLQKISHHQMAKVFYSSGDNLPNTHFLTSF